MLAPTDESPFRAEWDLLHVLRDTPRLLERIAHVEGSELHFQTELRRDYPDPLVRAALTLCDLRRRAACKFSRADVMWFDRTGFEQATAEAVARHKADRFSGAIVDLCCGIGGDTLALAARGTVTAVDTNPLACLRQCRNRDRQSPR
jgi:hypothetical protein